MFRSGHENTFRPIVKLFTVSPEGELPEQMPMERGILCSFSPDGSKLVYNRRGDEEYYWKRYKGGQYTDIWMYDFAAKSFTPVTDYVGKNAYPMWIGKQDVLRLRPRQERHREPLHLRLRHEADRPGDRLRGLRRPAALDRRPFDRVRARRAAPRARHHDERRARGAVEMPSDRWELAERTVNPRDYIQAMGVGNDGKAVVFEARGDIYLVTGEEGRSPRNLTSTPGHRASGSRSSHPTASASRSTRTRRGEYQIYAMNVIGRRSRGSR